MSILFVYVALLNAYILLFRNRNCEDAQIHWFKRLKVYLIEGLICMFIGSAIGTTALNSSLIGNWIFVISTILLTTFYPAKNYYKDRQEWERKKQKNNIKNKN